MAFGGRKRHGSHPRTIEKIHLIVRLAIANPHYTNVNIGNIMGLGPVRIAQIMKLPLYQQIHHQYLTGVVTKLDAKVDDNYKLARASMEFAVPIAMQTLVQQALNAKDERVKNKACNDILDRDGHFVKASRNIIVAEGAGAATEKDTKDIDLLVKALNEQKKLNLAEQENETNVIQ